MILLAKFGEQEGQRSSFEVRESYGVGVRKIIHKWWPTVIARSLFVVGNGRGVKFWQDSWCGNDDLKVFFPSK